MVTRMLLAVLKTLILLVLAGTIGIANAEDLPDPLESGWKGNKVCEKLHDDEKQRILRCTFPPGVGHEKHYHAPNFGYTISGGKVRITDAKGIREVTIKTGDSHVSPEGTAWHEIVNIGNTTIIYLVVEVK